MPWIDASPATTDTNSWLNDVALVFWWDRAEARSRSAVVLGRWNASTNSIEPITVLGYWDANAGQINRLA